MILGKWQLFFLGCMLCILPLSAQVSIEKAATPIKVYKSNIQQPLTASERQMIDEVYGKSAENFIYARQEKLRSIKDILRNRIEILQINSPEKAKSTKLLSQIPLFTAFNPDLKRDPIFNKSTFNPLKYDLGFYSNETSIIKVDNSNYFIRIKAQNQ